MSMTEQLQSLGVILSIFGGLVLVCALGARLSDKIDSNNGWVDVAIGAGAMIGWLIIQLISFVLIPWMVS